MQAACAVVAVVAVQGFRLVSSAGRRQRLKWLNLPPPRQPSAAKPSGDALQRHVAAATATATRTRRQHTWTGSGVAEADVELAWDTAAWAAGSGPKHSRPEARVPPSGLSLWVATGLGPPCEVATFDLRGLWTPPASAVEGGWHGSLAQVLGGSSDGKGSAGGAVAPPPQRVFEDGDIEVVCIRGQQGSGGSGPTARQFHLLVGSWAHSTGSPRPTTRMQAVAFVRLVAPLPALLAAVMARERLAYTPPPRGHPRGSSAASSAPGTAAVAQAPPSPADALLSRMPARWHPLLRRVGGGGAEAQPPLSPKSSRGGAVQLGPSPAWAQHPHLVALAAAQTRLGGTATAGAALPRTKAQAGRSPLPPWLYPPPPATRASPRPGAEVTVHLCIRSLHSSVKRSGGGGGPTTAFSWVGDAHAAAEDAAAPARRKGAAGVWDAGACSTTVHISRVVQGVALPQAGGAEEGRGPPLDADAPAPAPDLSSRPPWDTGAATAPPASPSAWTFDSQAGARDSYMAAAQEAILGTTEREAEAAALDTAAALVGRGPPARGGGHVDKVPQGQPGGMARVSVVRESGAMLRGEGGGHGAAGPMAPSWERGALAEWRVAPWPPSQTWPVGAAGVGGTFAALSHTSRGVAVVEVGVFSPPGGLLDMAVGPVVFTQGKAGAWAGRLLGPGGLLVDLQVTQAPGGEWAHVTRMDLVVPQHTAASWSHA